jgi:hypothetical protein
MVVDDEINRHQEHLGLTPRILARQQRVKQAEHRFGGQPGSVVVDENADLLRPTTFGGTFRRLEPDHRVFLQRAQFVPQQEHKELLETAGIH